MSYSRLKHVMRDAALTVTLTLSALFISQSAQAGSCWWWRSPTADRLRKNMVKVGFRDRPNKWTTHHIVAHGEKRWPSTYRARDVLDRNHIDYDNWKNGVYLPHNTTKSPYCYHPRLNNEHYHNTLAGRLERADEQGTVAITLREVANELRRGTFANCAQR